MTSSKVVIDKSAWEQVRHSEVARSEVRRLILRGELAVCEPVALEVLYAARNLADYRATKAQLGAQEWLAPDARASARALEVQELLAQRGMHRLAVVDLLVAATAELHGATVLHHDRDFDRIAAVTGQPTRWIVPPGSGFGGDQ